MSPPSMPFNNASTSFCDNTCDIFSSPLSLRLVVPDPGLIEV
jgi:hypothetical protein